MADKQSNSQVTHEVQRQFLRRTPIKLKQFARLLNDMVEQVVDPLRVKALLSQVTKTREACLTQDFESTARLLNQLIKQLSMSGESLESQHPLLKRLSRKLQEHSEKLELGVKPQRESPNETVDSGLEVNEVEETAADDPENEWVYDQFGIYIDKGKLIFVADDAGYNEPLCEQFESLGVESCVVDNLAAAKDLAQKDEGSIVVAGLALVESVKVLADESVETPGVPLIFTADEDNQENRAKAVRNGGTGFIIEPISVSSLCDQIERLHDLDADTPKRVLVMEDSKAQARYYEKVLGKGHFNIRVVNDPAVFLEALRFPA